MSQIENSEMISNSQRIHQKMIKKCSKGMNTKVLSSYLLCVNMFGVPFSILDALLNKATYVISKIQIMHKNGTSIISRNY